MVVYAAGLHLRVIFCKVERINVLFLWLCRILAGCSLKPELMTQRYPISHK